MAAESKIMRQVVRTVRVSTFLCIVISHVGTWSRCTKKTPPLPRLNAGPVKKKARRGCRQSSPLPERTQENGLQKFVAANPLEAASVLLHLPVSLLHD